MKKELLKILFRTLFLLILYAILSRILAGTHIIAGVFCPGPHLPSHHVFLIGLFILCRVYIVLLPGFLLNWLGRAWFKTREKRHF